MKKFSERAATRGAPPWGYSRSPQNPRKLQPVSAALELLEEAFDYLDKDHPYRDVARWLSAKSGIPISYVSLWRKYLKRVSEKTRLIRQSVKNAELANG